MNCRKVKARMIYIFGQIVAKSLSKISNSEIKEEAKFEMQNLLFQTKVIHSSLSYLYITLLKQHLRAVLEKRCS